MNFFDNRDSEFKRKLDKTKEEKRLNIHSFHRYYGKLIPAIPRCAIKEFTKKGDVVFDPFLGSGTTAVESAFLERNFIGIEINPLSVFISKVKTQNYDIYYLNKLYDIIINLIENDYSEVKEEEKPFCINRDHWFKDYVQRDLVKIKRNIYTAIEKLELVNKQKYIDFLLGVLSAIIKQVSNADTMHVFPGISKRIRRLEEEGKININVIETFKRGLKKRINYIEEFGNHKTNINIINDNSAYYDFSKIKNSIDLIVTNPPYISSVRYAETLKLELYWMEICESSKEYLNLSDIMIGNDHILKNEYQNIKITKYDFINNYINKLFEIDKKQAIVVYNYFTLMEKVIINMNLILKKNKKLVMKISDSKIRKIKIPTGKLLSQIAEQNGFKLVDYFNDKINENSRSLLTSRNTYSDIILEDNIIIWEKIRE